MRANNEAIWQEVRQPEVERPCNREEKVDDPSSRSNKSQIGEQTVESKSEIGVVMCRVIVRGSLERILKRVTVKTNGAVRQTVKVSVGRYVPQKQRNTDQEQNGRYLLAKSQHRDAVSACVLLKGDGR